mmetsp:Transcript_6682/g.24766  ORF Transcript_6682/g.24766 Transcript_6682/m.24766 type:complete len:315 (+) Transcript_6682:735-1679(+)
MDEYRAEGDVFVDVSTQASAPRVLALALQANYNRMMGSEPSVHTLRLHLYSKTASSQGLSASDVENWLYSDRDSPKGRKTCISRGETMCVAYVRVNRLQCRIKLPTFNGQRVQGCSCLSHHAAGCPLRRFRAAGGDQNRPCSRMNGGAVGLVILYLAISQFCRRNVPLRRQKHGLPCVRKLRVTNHYNVRALLTYRHGNEVVTYSRQAFSILNEGNGVCTSLRRVNQLCSAYINASDATMQRTNPPAHLRIGGCLVLYHLAHPQAPLPASNDNDMCGAFWDRQVLDGSHWLIDVQNLFSKQRVLACIRSGSMQQ